MATSIELNTKKIPKSASPILTRAIWLIQWKNFLIVICIQTMNRTLCLFLLPSLFLWCLIVKWQVGHNTIAKQKLIAQNFVPLTMTRKIKDACFIKTQ